jgi:RND superfamily putative drug exporter
VTAVQVRDVITRRPDHADLQDGRLQGPLGYTSFGGIIPWVPLFMFVLLFGLSMDYHVFILSRIRELHSRGASTATRSSAASQAAPGW